MYGDKLQGCKSPEQALRWCLSWWNGAFDTTQHTIPTVFCSIFVQQSWKINEIVAFLTLFQQDALKFLTWSHINTFSACSQITLEHRKIYIQFEGLVAGSEKWLCVFIFTSFSSIDSDAYCSTFSVIMFLQALLECRKRQDNCSGSTVGLFCAPNPQRTSFLLFFYADYATILHQALGILQSRGSSILCQVCLDMEAQFC